MRKVIEKIAKKIKGNDFEINKEITTHYLFSQGIDMILSLVRGLFTLGLNVKGKFFFRAKKVSLKCKNKISLGNKVRINEYVLIDALSIKGVSLGENCVIGANTIIKCTGSLKDIGQGLKMGNNTSCGEYCFFGAAGGIQIGDDVIMGQNVRFHSQNHNYKEHSVLIRKQGVTSRGIQIGNDCWIGAGVVFLDGVTVGNGCVIGANSVVTKNIPENSVVVGAPAKIVNKR